jgi:hypothetical protein
MYFACAYSNSFFYPNTGKYLASLVDEKKSLLFGHYHSMLTVVALIILMLMDNVFGEDLRNA